MTEESNSTNNKNLSSEETRRRKREYLKRWRELNYDRERNKARQYEFINAERIREQRRKYRKQNRDYLNFKLRQWYTNHPGYWVEYRKNHKSEISEYRKRLYNKTREKIFDIIGHKCVKCGFNDKRILHIDHINGGGCFEQEIYGNNNALYKYYSKHLDEAKKKLQPLCPNCNALKRIENDEQPYFKHKLQLRNMK